MQQNRQDVNPLQTSFNDVNIILDIHFENIKKYIFEIKMVCVCVFSVQFH